MSASSPPPPVDPAALQALLDALPAPLQPLDVAMLDGYLCGVLLQPQRIDEARWFAPVLDEEGRPPPPGTDVRALRELVRRRHAELNAAIQRRDWFDPWIYEPEDEGTDPSHAVAPWVVGFATACAHFPALMERDDPALLEPLALICMHLDADELEDADALVAEIETLEPPQDMTEAVESLVRACLLIADVTRPVRQATRPAAQRPAGSRRGPPKPGGPRRR